MIRSWLVGGIVAFTLVAQAAENEVNVSPTPASVAALQLKTVALYDTLSYTAVFKSTTIEEFSKEPFKRTATCTYSKRGTSLLLTREDSNLVVGEQQYKDGKEAGVITKVREVPIIRRLLITDEFALLWSDSDTPVLDQTFAADWKDSDRGYAGHLSPYIDGGDVKLLCFGPSVPFHTLMSYSPEVTDWTVSNKDETTQELLRNRTIGPQETLQDFTLRVDKRYGLLRSAVTKTKTGSGASYALDYTAFVHKSGPLDVPKSCLTQSVDARGAVLETSEITFSDFKDESDLPAYTFADVGAPEGAEVWRRKPTGIEFYKWKDGKLEPLSGPDLGLRAPK